MASTADDPVTAEYDVYLTPALQDQIILLQYISRARDRPYNARTGQSPGTLRMKPKSGFLEVDIEMRRAFNFNKFQSVKWGDALQTAKQLQNDTATYGPASGFAVPRVRQGNRGQLLDAVDRQQQLIDDMTNMDDAAKEGRVFSSQTLGGKIIGLDHKTEIAQPMYFAGAFRGKELHLSKVDATVQVRPQFHHVDAEDHRNRVAASRAVANEAENARPPAPARALQQSYKDLNDDKDKDAPERKLRQLLQDAEEEPWTNLQYIDEQEDLAYDTFNRCMFVEQPEDAKPLKSTLNAEDYLDRISLPRHDTHRRKKRPPRKKGEHIDLADDVVEE